MREVILSKRLQMLADMVTPCRRLVDVGCDHGFLSVYLVRSGICSGALAMDVRNGPLEGARKHIAQFGLGDYIEVRLSDGLGAYVAGEADAMVCAGMGGRLMEKILTEGMEKAKKLKELILQPQSELEEFRAFLRRAGFTVTEENAVREEGKFYFAMKAVPGKSDFIYESEALNAGKGSAVGEVFSERKKGIGHLWDAYGKLLLEGRNLVLQEYLGQRQAYLKKLLEHLARKGTESAGKRLGEIREELEDVEEALLYF